MHCGTVMYLLAYNWTGTLLERHYNTGFYTTSFDCVTCNKKVTCNKETNLLQKRLFHLQKLILLLTRTFLMWSTVSLLICMFWRSLGSALPVRLLILVFMFVSFWWWLAPWPSPVWHVFRNFTWAPWRFPGSLWGVFGSTWAPWSFWFRVSLLLVMFLGKS